MNAWKIAAAGLMVGASALVGLAAPMQPQPYSGNGDFQTYCASCHGTSAKGDGEIAKWLTKKPADLTQLSRRNGGVFPEEKAFKSVDGRSSHSGSDMPVWADVFAKATESAGEKNAAARIEVLVKYLETLQVK